MNKPTVFTAKIFFDMVRFDDSGKFEIIQGICESHAFNMDYDCGSMFFGGSDSIYELLEARVIFITRAMKKEKVNILRYNIKATVFDSKIHGELI